MVYVLMVPYLIAGPILRRTEERYVTIWLATTDNKPIEGEIFHIKKLNNVYQYQQIKTKTVQNTIQAGDHLYLHLLRIESLTEGFPTNSLLGYNLYFAEQFDLQEFDLLNRNNPDSIVYGNLDYPTFFIRDEYSSNFLYGSCQKPHSEGKSAFTSADLTLQEKYDNLEERPNALFLMGDQIYADDVGDPMFHLISKWTNKLIGEDKEKIKQIDKRLNTEPFNESIDQINGRQYIMQNFAKFTSNNASNHMIRFSEYIIMYLLTLSPTLWNRKDSSTFPAFDEIIERNELYLIFPDREGYEKYHKKEINLNKKRYNAQLQSLKTFQKTLPQIRRILANTPTYMIFDDHDITDDWNITFTWSDQVYRSNLGKYTVANGLTAYLLVQAWGNDPEKFEQMLPLIRNNMNYYLVNSYFHDEWQKLILRFNNWTFTSPTNPKALFLNTRTMREYDIFPEPVRVFNKIDEAKRPAQLISKSGWRKTSKTLFHSGWRRREPLIIISPTPLYGISIIETFLRHFIYPLRILGLPIQYDLDFEAWKYNGIGFNNFLQMVARWSPKQCIILSGDVHYATSIRSKIQFKYKKTLTIQQYTSSPIKNMSFTGIWGKILKFLVWINSFKVKRRTIYRSLSDKYILTTEKKKFNIDKNIKWCEEINYLISSKNSVIETKNNIGLLTVNNGSSNNKLLM